MQFIDRAISSIRHTFNTVAQSDTGQGAAIGASVGFALTGGNPVGAAIGAAIGGFTGAENLRTIFNAAVYGPQPALVPVPVASRYNGPSGPRSH